MRYLLVAATLVLVGCTSATEPKVEPDLKPERRTVCEPVPGYPNLAVCPPQF